MRRHSQPKAAELRQCPRKHRQERQVPAILDAEHPRDGDPLTIRAP